MGVSAIAWVQRHTDNVRCRGTAKEVDRFQGVVLKDTDPIAGFDPEIAERIGKPQTTSPRFAVGQPARLTALGNRTGLDDRRILRMKARRASHQSSHVHTAQRNRTARGVPTLLLPTGLRIGTSLDLVRSVATFTALMVTGVLIVLIYIRSGESLVALALSLITLFVVLGLWQWRPWALDGSTRRGAGAGATLLDRSEPIASAPVDGPPCWRCPMDITWDDRGVSGVALGARAPQLWSWSQIDDIGEDWCTADHDPADPGGERLAFRLDFPDLRNPEEPAQAWVRYGRNQDPEQVKVEARAAWRDSKMRRSRFFDLTAQERTLQLVEHLASEQLDVSDSPRSPEVLYQEVRRELLSGGELCRLSGDAPFDDVLDAFDGMLAANRVDGITQDEADELAACDGRDRIAALHWMLDSIVEERGLRVVFLDDGPPGGRNRSRSSGVMDYLLGLVPAAVADDWDGQMVGSGSARVVLDRPTT